MAYLGNPLTMMCPLLLSIGALIGVSLIVVVGRSGVVLFLKTMERVDLFYF